MLKHMEPCVSQKPSSGKTITVRVDMDRAEWDMFKQRLQVLFGLGDNPQQPVTRLIRWWMKLEPAKQREIMLPSLDEPT